MVSYSIISINDKIVIEDGDYEFRYFGQTVKRLYSVDIYDTNDESLVLRKHNGSIITLTILYNMRHNSINLYLMNASNNTLTISNITVIKLLDDLMQKLEFHQTEEVLHIIDIIENYTHKMNNEYHMFINAHNNDENPFKGLPKRAD